MINFSNNNNQVGIKITDIQTCDFSTLNKLSNEDILGDKSSDNTKLARFIQDKMGIQSRYHVADNINAYDLAKQALGNLVSANPDIINTADFLIYAGISNPYPVSTISAMLANEFDFTKPSCWDIKSGCSSGVLALIQAYSWIILGAKKGVIVCSETLSKFIPPGVIQMSASVGDGAVALIIEASNEWIIKSIVHGTEPQYINDMAVKAKIPLSNSEYDREAFRFVFQEKGKGVKRLSEIWIESLQQILLQSNLKPTQVSYYVPHQVDATKNALVAEICGIPDNVVAKNFLNYGNMGCPTVFINYYQLVLNNKLNFTHGDHLVFQAVGGGISWAGICLQYIGK